MKNIAEQKAALDEKYKKEGIEEILKEYGIKIPAKSNKSQLIDLVIEHKLLDAKKDEVVLEKEKKPKNRFTTLHKIVTFIAASLAILTALYQWYNAEPLPGNDKEGSEVVLDGAAGEEGKAADTTITIEEALDSTIDKKTNPVPANASGDIPAPKKPTLAKVKNFEGLEEFLLRNKIQMTYSGNLNEIRKETGLYRYKGGHIVVVAGKDSCHYHVAQLPSESYRGNNFEYVEQAIRKQINGYIRTNFESVKSYLSACLDL